MLFWVDDRRISILWPEERSIWRHKHSNFSCLAYSCFDKGCPKRVKKRTRQCRKVVWEILINFNKQCWKLTIHFVSFNTHKQVFIAPPSIALKTRELDDATVNNHNPSCLSVLSRTLLCFSVGQPFSKQLYTILKAIIHHSVDEQW